MSILINTLYSILTWLSAFVIGFVGTWGWLGWSLLVMASIQSWALIIEAWNKP